VPASFNLLKSVGSLPSGFFIHEAVVAKGLFLALVFSISKRESLELLNNSLSNVSSIDNIK